MTIFDPHNIWKKQTITNFSIKELLIPIFKNGKKVYNSPTINEIKNYCAKQVDSLWDEVKRFENPHNYYVDLSEKLWSIKNTLIAQNNCK